ncbi:MAG: hypothetical protein KDA58_03520 [Planctomycetaceae bacterium]|nr:hypothetical protein [Planctomycetaceae bacterium]
MRRTILAVAVVAATLAAGNMAEAARGRVIMRPRTPIFQRGYNGPGIFARLMELERAKNAWLFGR